MLKILVIGSGAREHAIVRALNRSPKKKEIYCLATNLNPGISEVCTDLIVCDINDPVFVKNFAQDHKFDFAIIGPENPLANGIADILSDIKIGTIGPKKELAQIETSKSFTRNLLAEYKIPGSPKFKTFKTMDGVEAFLMSLGENYVVKYDGLAGGKGVKVAGDHLHSHEEAKTYCKELIANGGVFVIEKKLIGQEFSLMSFCDGTSLSHMPAVQDHKRAYEGDTGPNTGGMGTYSDSDHSLPFLENSHIRSAQRINEKTATALKNKFGKGYKGILYGGFIATADGVQLIEYNARFGDPEAMNVLSILETDLIEICEAIIKEELDKINISFSNLATVCKYAVPDGYPDDPVKNKQIDISSVKDQDKLFYASVELKGSDLFEAGSRTVAVVGTGETIWEAEEIAEKEISNVKGPLFHRKDIGTTELIQKKINHMSSLQ
jgi:phosphoribosylamine--glycine ligase|tara:strand:+ start:107 stop:1417 length:1311 start_codon:yes stop_codon:yes gene_type:complete